MQAATARTRRLVFKGDAERSFEWREILAR
jgi:hypothetical protein